MTTAIAQQWRCAECGQVAVTGPDASECGCNCIAQGMAALGVPAGWDGYPRMVKRGEPYAVEVPPPPSHMCLVCNGTGIEDIWGATGATCEGCWGFGVVQTRTEADDGNSRVSEDRA